MYLKKLNRIMPIKNIACKYLAKRYGKPVDYFAENLEEIKEDNRFYYIIKNEDGESQDIVYLFTDFSFASNIEGVEELDVDWMKMIYSRIKQVSYKDASMYLISLRNRMFKKDNDLFKSRLDEINKEYSTAIRLARLTKDAKIEKNSDPKYVKKVKADYQAALAKARLIREKKLEIAHKADSSVAEKYDKICEAITGSGAGYNL